MATAKPKTDSAQSGEELNKQISEKYRVTEGVEPSEINVGGDEHPLARMLGDKDHYEFEYDPRATGISIAERYDEPAAALREYIHNAETACIRRVRKELLDIGYTEDEVLDMSLEEAKDIAAEEAGYMPVIEIEYNWPGSDRPALTFRDNGIGISEEELLVLKKHAHSTSFLDGSVGGQFGQGIYSIFMLIGHEEKGKFQTRSRMDDSSYETQISITGLNPMPGHRDEYGTTFTFPALSEEGKDVDIAGKVEEFCQGIRVPVIYEEFDERNNHVYQDDFVPMALEDDYDDLAPLVTYETKYFRAVSSPETAKNRDPKTLLTSMPISRNDGRFSGTNNDKFDAPWKFDIRLNYEDGRIAFGPHAGLVPTSDKKYEKMTDDRQEHYIPRSEMSCADFEMPKPVDDRDRLRDGHRDFFQKVSQGLSRAFSDKYAEVLSNVDEFDDFLKLDSRERAIFMRGYSHFGPSTRRSDPQNVQEKLEEEVGVTVSLDICEKMSVMKRDVMVVPRDASDPSKIGGRHRSNREMKKIWRVISETEPDGDVFMSKTVSNKKANLAWELSENNVVIQLHEDTIMENYDKGESLFDWRRLKDLPSKNLAEKYPELSDEFLDKWDSTGSSSGSTKHGRGSYDRDRAKKRSIKVRRGRGSNHFTTHQAEDVYGAMDNGDKVKAGGWSENVSELIVVDQNEHHVGEFSHLCFNGAGMAVVPRYVHDYLLEADNTYTPEGIRRAHYNRTIDFDWSAPTRSSSGRVGQLGRNDIILVVRSQNLGLFQDRFDAVREFMDGFLTGVRSDYSIGDMESFTIMKGSELKPYWMALKRDGRWTSDATVYYTSKRNMPSHIKNHAFGMNDAKLFLEIELPPEEYNRDAPEWERLFGHQRGLDNTMRQLVTMVQDLDRFGGLAIDHPFPSQRNDDRKE